MVVFGVAVCNLDESILVTPTPSLPDVAKVYGF
jgi:hypothetical protein